MAALTPDPEGQHKSHKVWKDQGKHASISEAEQYSTPTTYRNSINPDTPVERTAL